jgi:IS605 OrfB family transposase
MKAIRTVKLKLTSETTRFTEVATNYRNACNWLSPIVFALRKPSTPAQLSKEFYTTIREKFQLPSQVTCSLFRHVVSTYRTMKSNKQWELAIFKKLIVPLCWRRDFSVTSKSPLSIWGKPVTFQSKEIPVGQWSDSKLKYSGRQWYLCLTVEIDIPDVKTKGTIVGVDSGIKNILTATDKKTNKTLYISGSVLNHRRLCLRQTKAKVASVGTPSAHRLLKRLSGREKSVTQHLIHTASKQLVAFAESVDARSIVMEDLTGIRKSKKPTHHKQRARNNRWPFRQCQFYISYKAAAKGIGVEFVSPAHTSQSCPICGHTEKANRNGLKFRCVICNFCDNSDRVGSINIGLRSLLQRQAVGERASINTLIVAGEGNEPVQLQTPTL